MESKDKKVDNDEQNTRKRKNVQLKSVVWQCFTKIENDTIVKCNHCHPIVQYAFDKSGK